MAQSQAILARRKKGKTAFLQRYFNLLWSNEGSKIIPFYYSIQEKNMTLAEFAKEFFATFVSHYLSYVERNLKYVSQPLTYEEIGGYIRQVDGIHHEYLQDGK